MPQKITGVAVANGLTEAFGLTGKLALSLDETVVPTVVVGSLEEALWGPSAVGTIIVGAAAGFRSEVELSIPQLISGVGAAAIVDAIEIPAGVNTAIDVGQSPGLPAPNVFGNTAWTDVGRRGGPIMGINGKNNAVASVGFIGLLRLRVLALTTQRFPLGWILRDFPDTGLQQGLMVRPVADNETFTINVFWRERVPR